MKTRTGFVSNSSSSSFVLIVGKHTYDKVLNGLDDFSKDVLEWVAQSCKLDGQEIFVIEGWSGNDGYFLEGYKPGQGKTGYVKGADKAAEEDRWGVWDDIETKLKAGGEGTFFYSHQEY